MSFEGIDLLDIEELKRNAFDKYFIAHLSKQSAEGSLATPEYFRFLGAFAIAAGLFYVGYQIKEIRKPAYDIAASLREINQKADQVKEIIEDVAGDIKRIIEKIEKLIEEIKGVISEQFLNDAMGRADGIRQVIMGYTRDPEVFSSNLERVQNNVDKLVEEAGRIRMHSKHGMAYLFSVAPIMSLWIQSFEMVEKARAKLAAQNNSEYVSRKFEEQAFFTENMSLFKNLFGRTSEKAREFVQQKQTSPLYLKRNKAYLLVNGVFEESPILVPKNESEREIYKFIVKWKADAQGDLEEAELWYMYLQYDKSTSKWKRYERPLNLNIPLEYDAYNVFKRSYQPFMHQIEGHLAFNTEVERNKDKVLSYNSVNPVMGGFYKLESGPQQQVQAATVDAAERATKKANLGPGS